MVLRWFVPEAQWMLPGLWKILVSLEIFASARSMPHSITIAGAWYFVVGTGVLMLASGGHVLSPWTMGCSSPPASSWAALLHFADRENHDEA
jgi:hypothetical protein